MGNDGSVRTTGVIRISFPFGEVQMDCNNASELERVHEMAAHMLKVHEEMNATNAIKKNLKDREPQEEPVMEQAMPMPGVLTTR